MGDNNWWFNRAGRVAPVSNPGSATPNYGLAYDVATAPYDTPDQFDTVADALTAFASTGLFQAPAGAPAPQPEHKSLWDHIKSGASDVGNVLAGGYGGVVEGTNWINHNIFQLDEGDIPKSLSSGAFEAPGAADQAGLSGWEKLKFVGKAQAGTSIGKAVQQPGAEQIFWGLDKVNEGFSTTAVAASLAEDDFGLLFKSGTWGDAHEITQKYHLNAGEAFSQMFYDNEVIKDPQRFEQIRQHNTVFNVGSLAFNVVMAWKMDPNVIFGKGIGASRDLAVGKLATNGRTREVQRDILSAPDLASAKEAAGQYTSLADKLRASHAVSLFDRAQQLRQAAQGMGFERFKNLPAFSNSASGPTMAKLMQDVADDDDAWNLVFRSAIGDPMAVGELAARQGEVSDKIAAIELKTMPGLQADLDRMEARYQKRLAEQGKPQDARIEIVRFGDKWLDDEVSALRAETDALQQKLATYTTHESWLQRALPGLDQATGVLDSTAPNAIFGNLDRLGGKGVVRRGLSAHGGAVNMWQHDDYSPASWLLRAPTKPFLKRVGVVSLNDVEDGSSAVTSYLNQIDYIRGGRSQAARDGILAAFAGATTDMERKVVVERLERSGITALGEKYGLSPEIMDRLGREIQKQRGISWGKFTDTTIYSPIPGKNGPGYVSFVDDAGNLQQIKMPVDVSQLANFHPLTNLTDLDRAIRENMDLLRSMDDELASRTKAGVAWTRRHAMEFTDTVGAYFNSFWKPLALLSIRWPMRVVADESMRVMLLAGVLPHMAQWGKGAGYTLRNAGAVRPYEWWRGRKIRTGSLAEDSLRAGARNDFDAYDYRAITNPNATVPLDALDFGKIDTKRYDALNAATAKRWGYLRKVEAAGAWRRDAALRIGMTREDFEATGEDLLHGTIHQFDQFGAGVDRNGMRHDGSAFYFTNDEKVARHFGEDRAYGYLNREDPGFRHVSFADDEDFRNFLRDKKVADGLQRIDDEGDWHDISVNDVTLDDFEGETLRRRVHKNARTVQAKVYGKTLDLGAPRIVGKSGQRFHREFTDWFNALPDDVQHFLKTSDSPVAKATRRALKGTQGEYGFNWREHTGDKALIRFAREHGYGKIRVPDSAAISGEYSTIALPEYIGHNRDVVGEFYPKTDWPEPPAWATRWDERLAEAEKGVERGFFMDPVSHRATKKGFAVSVYPGRLRTFDRKPTARELNYWTEKNSDLLAIPQNKVAVWLDKDTGRWHMDVVKTTKRREDAMLLASKANAPEFYDIEDGFTRFMSEDFYNHFDSPFMQPAAGMPGGAAIDQQPILNEADSIGEAIGNATGVDRTPRAKHKVGFGTKKWKSRDGKIVEGEDVFGQDSLNGNIYYSVVSSRDPMRNMFGGYTKGLGVDRQSRNGSDYRVFDPSEGRPDEWATAYAAFVNNHVKYSPFWNRMLDGQTDDQIYDWLMGTAEGRKVRQRIPLRGSNPGKWVSDTREIFEYLFPNERALMAAAERDLTPDDVLHLIPESERMSIHGDSLKLGLGTSGRTKLLGRVVDGMMNYLASVPTDALVRHPFAATVYNREMRNYLASVPADQITNNVLAAAEAAARAKAVRQIRRTLYNIADEREGVHMLRYISPFFQAQLEVLERYARISMEKPESVARIAQLLQGTQVLPSPFWEVQDREGNKAKGYSSENQVVMQVAPWMRDFVNHVPGLKGGLDYAGTLQVPVASLNMILQGDVPFLPSMGPLVTFPASELYFKDRPELEHSAVARWMFPFGMPQGANIGERFLDTIAPAWLKRTWAGETADFNDSAFASMVSYIGTQQLHDWEVNGRVGPRPTSQDAVDAAKHMYRLRAASSFILPAPLNPRSPYQFYIDQYHTYQEKYGADADTKFYDDFGPEFFLFAQSTTKAAGMAPTTEAFELYDKNKGLAERAPLLLGVLTGPGASGEFSDAVYQWQLGSRLDPASGKTIRERLSPQERIAQATVDRGWVEYGKLSAALDAELRNRVAAGGSPYLTAGTNADLAAIKDAKITEIIERNPGWQDAMNSRNSQREAWLTQAYGVAFDSQLDDRVDIQALRAYLIGRARLQDALIERKATGQSSSDQFSYDPLGNPIGDNADLAYAWSSWVNETKSANPLFAEIYNRYLEGDDLSIYIPAEVSSG